MSASTAPLSPPTRGATTAAKPSADEKTHADQTHERAATTANTIETAKRTSPPSPSANGQTDASNQPPTSTTSTATHATEPGRTTAACVERTTNNGQHRISLAAGTSGSGRNLEVVPRRRLRRPGAWTTRMERADMRKLCSIEGCTRLVHGHGWCMNHYMRWRKHGDPEWEKPIFTVCIIDGCDRAPRSRTADLCDVHYCRRWRTGSVDGVGTTRLVTPGYRAAHTRVARDRGKASAYTCIDCSEQAGHWSFAWRRVPKTQWLWGTSNSKAAPSPYTGDPGHYEPRCHSCAAIYDKDTPAQPDTDLTSLV